MSMPDVPNRTPAEDEYSSLDGLVLGSTVADALLRLSSSSGEQDLDEDDTARVAAGRRRATFRVSHLMASQRRRETTVTARVAVFMIAMRSPVRRHDVEGYPGAVRRPHGLDQLVAGCGRDDLLRGAVPVHPPRGAAIVDREQDPALGVNVELLARSEGRCRDRWDATHAPDPSRRRGTRSRTSLLIDGRLQKSWSPVRESLHSVACTGKGKREAAARTGPFPRLDPGFGRRDARPGWNPSGETPMTWGASLVSRPIATGDHSGGGAGVGRLAVTTIAADDRRRRGQRESERAPPAAEAPLDRRGQRGDRRPAIALDRPPARGRRSAAAIAARPRRAADAARRESRRCWPATLERGERALAVQRGVHRDAQAELIGASVHSLAAEDLGRDVARRADAAGPGAAATFREPSAGRARSASPRMRATPEVADPGDTVAAQEDVLRLEVSMHEAGRVRRGQPSRGLQIHAHDLAPGSRLCLQPVRHRAAVDELHHHEEPVAAQADVVDGGDVGMAEVGHRLRLAREPALSRTRDRSAGPPA